MRRIYLTILTISFSTSSFCQTSIDSLRHRLAIAISDTAKSHALHNIGNYYVHTHPDSALQYAYAALKIAEKEDFNRIKIHARLTIGMVVGYTGGYVKALQLLHEGTALAEKENNVMAQARASHITGNLYKWKKDFQTAINYYKKALHLSERLGENTYLTEMNLSIVYMEENKLDSALMYAQKSYEHILKSESKSSYSSVLASLGRIHQRLGNALLGRNYLGMAEADLANTHLTRHKCFLNLELSNFFKDLGNADSSIYYAKAAINLPGAFVYKPPVLDASQQLAYLYTGKNTDSAFKYLQLATTLKEELLGTEQTQQMQALRFEEELRQQQISLQKEKAEEDRKHNLQYAAIALGLVTLAIFFFLFSHSIIANQRFIKFLGILSLLIVFEFLNLLLHPYLGALTHHQPLFMLGAMVCIAALLIPLHHKLEHWITHKMVEKNNKIRLAAAKKTIEKLEGRASEKVADSTSTQHQL
jgi:tetratricopeptide (TPR) repeat protein